MPEFFRDTGETPLRVLGVVDQQDGAHSGQNGQEAYDLRVAILSGPRRTASRFNVLWLMCPPGMRAFASRISHSISPRIPADRLAVTTRRTQQRATRHRAPNRGPHHLEDMDALVDARFGATRRAAYGNGHRRGGHAFGVHSSCARRDSQLQGDSCPRKRLVIV